MKKLALLVLILIVGLPGCGKKKESSSSTVRKNTIEKYVQVGDNMDLIEEDADDEEDEDEENEDIEDYLEGLDLDDFDDLDTEDDNIDFMIEDTDEAFNWIDAQTDDEFKKLYFSFNHYGIREDQKAALNHDIDQVKQLVAEADSAAQPTIVFEGHACQEGTPAYNLALSERRAKNVADLFVAAGLDRSIMKVVGRGQECPEVSASSREGRAPNRRVEVRVIYT